METVIRQRIPSIISLINKNIDELNAELDRIGRPVGADGGVKDLTFPVFLLFGLINCFVLFLIRVFSLYLQAQLYTILELCRAFDRVFKEHIDGG